MINCKVQLTRTNQTGLFLKHPAQLTNSTTEELVIRASTFHATASYILPLMLEALQALEGGDTSEKKKKLANAIRLLQGEEYRQRAGFVNAFEPEADIFLSIFSGLDNIFKEHFNYNLFIPGSICVDELKHPGHREHLFRLLTSEVVENSTKFTQMLAEEFHQHESEVPVKVSNLHVGIHKSDLQVANSVIPADNCYPIYHRNLCTTRTVQAKVVCYAEMFDLLHSPESREFVRDKSALANLAKCFCNTILRFTSSLDS